MLRRPNGSATATHAARPELRAALQGYLWRARALRCEPDQIVVVNGSQQGLDLCARLLLDPGDTAVIENPCYLLARQTFLAAGRHTDPLRGGPGGHADRPGSRTRASSYVTPSHQFPLGSVMSVGRRQAASGLGAPNRRLRHRG